LSYLIIKNILIVDNLVPTNQPTNNPPVLIQSTPNLSAVLVVREVFFSRSNPRQ